MPSLSSAAARAAATAKGRGARDGRISSLPSTSLHDSESREQTNGEEQSKKKNRRKKKRRREDDGSALIERVSKQRSLQPSLPPEISLSGLAPGAAPQPAPTSSTRFPVPPPTLSRKKRKLVKKKPARFSHPQLDSELHRLGRPWLSPGDPLFQVALKRSYRGMRHEPANSLPQAVHKGFRQVFDDLHEAGLFLYDTVQAGGKRLSRTFVTRTLVGEPGITYKYLGLRLFAHPWDSEGGDFRKGPGDGLADALNDPCLSDLFRECGSRSGDGVRGGEGRGYMGRVNGDASRKATGREGRSWNKNTDKVGETLKKMGDLSEWMRQKASDLLIDEGIEGGAAGESFGEGSCEFNLTLINRMECTSAKRDLKPDPLFAMGKCSVSWHADSCLQDFSTIGVYHCTEPVPAQPDWGIALRVSKEAESDGGGDGDGGDADATGNGKAEKAQGGRANSGPPPTADAVGVTEADRQQEKEGEVSTPPLLFPLQSGDAYFLLDDFNHFHEHAVVSGSSTLRYSSTHRVAVTDGNTFTYVQKRCEEVLAGGGTPVKSGRILDLVQVRAEQALLTELEFEWLNQFWVQGRRHAILHPWWRGPMALVLATWRELERRTAVTVQRLMSLEHPGLRADAATSGGGLRPADPSAIAKAFETVLRALEERRESRSRWATRFADPAYRSLSPDCSPVVPTLWPPGGDSTGSGAGGGSRCDGGSGNDGDPLLPQSLVATISRLRQCYTTVYRAASGGKKAHSAKAITAGAASNWELFRAASSPSSSHAAEKPGGMPKKQAKKKNKKHRGGDAEGERGGGAGQESAKEIRVAGFRSRSGGGQGQSQKRKGPRNRR